MEVNSMPEIKQPSVKADSMRRNIAGAGSPAAAKPSTPAGKTAKKEGAPVVKKKIARKKAATSAKRASPGTKTKTVSADAASGSAPTSVDASRPAPAATRPALSRDARQRIIGEAAYLISLKREAGLSGPEADWLFAETVIDLVFDITD
jgi:hypothetical protein